MNGHKWLAAAMAVAIAMLPAGCGRAARNDEISSPPDQSQVRMQQHTPAKKEITNRAEVQLHLEELARNVDGVNNAHCVILGNTAIVGIDVDEHLERSRVGVIKYSVAEAFRNDPYGVDALVTADIDIASRLNEIGQDIRNGRPVAGFVEELADIMGRLVPQLPRDVMPAPEEQDGVPDADEAENAELAEPEAAERANR